MAFIPTPKTARCALEFSISTQTAVMTLWFEAEAEWSETALEDLGSALVTWVLGELLPLLSHLLTFDGVRATSQESSSAPSVFVPAPPSSVGGDPNAALSTQVASVVTFETGLRGRSFRGRNYVPGIPTDWQATPGSTNTSTLAPLLLAYAALSDVEAATSSNHVVVSHFADGAARSTGVTTVITAYHADTPFDTQRRRAIGRGA